MPFSNYLWQKLMLMVAALDSRKVRLINAISQLDNVKLVEKVEQLLLAELASTQNKALEALLQPIVEKTDLNEILKEQHYTGPNRKRFSKFVKELNIEEPIEQLMAQLTK